MLILNQVILDRDKEAIQLQNIVSQSQQNLQDRNNEVIKLNQNLQDRDKEIITINNIIQEKENFFTHSDQWRKNSKFHFQFLLKKYREILEPFGKIL